jgi:pimeloyl-ACP methyl ester carboxylesterase
MADGLSVTEHLAGSPRHSSFYLACGDEHARPIIFVHGWPELSISWRGQLPVFAGLGFRAIAPDMRGYGRSNVPPRRVDYALEVIGDMIELLDLIGAGKAIWVGHDWGAPVVWSIAQHHPELCHGFANLCVSYIPEGFAVHNILPLADRNLCPEDKFPFAQWDYEVC